MTIPCLWQAYPKSYKVYADSESCDVIRKLRLGRRVTEARMLEAAHCELLRVQALSVANDGTVHVSDSCTHIVMNI